MQVVDLSWPDGEGAVVVHVRFAPYRLTDALLTRAAFTSTRCLWLCLCASEEGRTGIGEGPADCRHAHQPSRWCAGKPLLQKLRACGRVPHSSRKYGKPH